MSMAGKRSYFTKKSLVSGHNVYKHIWMPGIGEELSVDKEPSNLHDNFAVSVVVLTYASCVDRLILEQLFPWSFPLCI